MGVSTNMPTFYDRFSTLAREKGYSSPTAAGEAMGFKSGTVSVWKLKGSTPQENTLQIVSDFFGVSKEWLLGKPVNRDGTELRGITRGLSVNYSFDTPQGEIEVKPQNNLQDFADNVLRLALFNGDENVTHDDIEEIRDYAKLILMRKARQKSDH